MLAVSHCQRVGIGEHDFELRLSIIQESACCCVKPPTIASKSCVCVGFVRSGVEGSPGFAQTAIPTVSSHLMC